MAKQEDIDGQLFTFQTNQSDLLIAIPTMRQFYHIAIRSVQKHLRLTLCVLCCTMLMDAKSQIGDFRNELALGVSGGYTINNVGFTPEIPQNSQGGYTAEIGRAHV